ncbi:MAG: O-antigen ligase family protein [Clostridium perfringens]
MSNVLSVIMVFSFIICIISPNNTVYYDNNYGKEVWKGVFTHKNTLGNFSALSIIFLFIEDKKFFLKWIIMIISIINLFKSGSNTPTVALIVCFSYFFVKKMLNKDLSKPIGIFSVVLSYIYIFKHALMGLILNDFNITLSDSGRYEIYEFIVGLLKQKVFCGYGIGTSWIEGTNTYNLVYNRFGFNPNSSYNGFLDIVFGIGVVGLILYLIILIYIFWVHRENNQYDTKFMVILIYLLILSIFESTLYNFKGVYWVLQMFCLFSLGNDNNLEIKEINYDKS